MAAVTLTPDEMNIQKIPISKLKPAKYNPRKDLKPGDPAYEKIKRSLNDFGYVDPIIWNEVTGNIVGGHQRFKVLKAEGAQEIMCVVVHIENPDDEKALNVVLNKATGDWEPVALADLLSELQANGYDLDSTGFDAAEVNDLFSNVHDRNVKGTQATMKCLYTTEQLEKATADEIYKRINEEFVYDEYRWQEENNIHVTYGGRAEGLHKVLYQCPNCGTEYKMKTHGTVLECTHCGKIWNYDELGRLSATDGKTEFSHIPYWYEWERSNVKKEVEAGTYSFECTAHVDMMPKDRYIHMGKAKLVHDMSGFRLTGCFEGESYDIKWPTSELYSCHIEYEYLGKFGDCVDLNTLDNTYYIYPEDCEFSVTKFALATEELYQHNNGSVG